MMYFSWKKIQKLLISILVVGSQSGLASDTELVDVKAEALRFYATIKAAENANSGELNRVSVYVGNNAETLVVQAAKIQIDDRTPVRYAYSKIESNVLLDGGLHEIEKLRLPVGNYRIRAEIIALPNDAGPNADRTFLRLDQMVSVNSETHIELGVVSNGMTNMMGSAELALRDWRPTL
ncbi:Uncharacterised protein [Zhongshania aliphaticivorans]|uniref:DUF5625 domain-containing protein n=1 Tax=Zhongshania aliphaticivorans TaxID=1470434 RepID=A0A5S9Q4R2_9GAMM|nr:hypothetical protein [Zhongshania aliphaticivorans]CAA0094824.1 Uncharacterised protein [Zhongshania aliphaticivorans]CAA0112708.1 Uncharacterised protein [Zhongshania aliphaticivorans]